MKKVIAAVLLVVVTNVGLLGAGSPSQTVMAGGDNHWCC